MDIKLYELYKELLLVTFPENKSVFERIHPSDLCISGHHKGRLYQGGLLIYGQAMNGWQNKETSNIEDLINEIMLGTEDFREMYTMADYNGWHGVVNGKSASYYYKRSKFWKLNYQVITNIIDPQFDNFYISQTEKISRTELLNNAWPQAVAWSNLYKVSFSEGGNPDNKVKETTNEICRKIIYREIELLRPSYVLFNTGENFFYDIALREGNIFGVKKSIEQNNIIYTGIYEYVSGQTCKIVVCRRPDDPRLHYKNSDIVNEATEILCAFKSI